MSLEEMTFFLDIPLETPIEVDPEDTSDSYTEQIILQQTLNYLAAKLSGMDTEVKTVYQSNVIHGYQEAVGDMADIFVSLQIKVKPDLQQSVGVIRYFNERFEDSQFLASHVLYRLKHSKWFAKLLVKVEDCPVEINEHTSSLIVAICLGNDLLCTYNQDQDDFIEQLVNMLLYSITDRYEE